MPIFTLTDVARFRVSTISLFLLVYLLASFGIYKLWNLLGKDFSNLPTLSFKRALVLILIWGLAFHLVLVMIAGTRELMTPGAWERKGAIYALTAGTTKPTMDARRFKLNYLKILLWQYAERHDGRFPPDQMDASFPAQAWQEPSGISPYIYLPGLSLGLPDARPLAYEPDNYGQERAVLLTGGQIELLPVDVIEAMKEGKP